MFCQGIHPVRTPKRQPPVRVRYCAPSWDDGIATVIIPKFKEMVPRKWLKGGSWDKAFNGERHTLSWENGSEIKFKCFNQQISTFGGDNLDAVYQDERGPENYFIENLARLVDRDGYFVAAMTPEYGITYEEDLVIEPPKGISVDYWFFETEKNQYLSAAGVAKVKASIKDPNLAETKLKGRFMPLSGMVLPQWNPAIHIIPDRPLHPDAIRVFCIDCHIKIPAAAMWAAWEPDGTLVVYRTAKRFLTVPEWKTFIRVQSAGEVIHQWMGDEPNGGEQADLNGNPSILAQFREGADALPIWQVSKPKGSFEAGIAKLWNMLSPDTVSHKPRISVFRSCDYGVTYENGKICGSLCWEIKRYCYKAEQKADEEELRERVRNVNNHYISDLMYIAMAGSPTVPKPQTTNRRQATHARRGKFTGLH